MKPKVDSYSYVKTVLVISNTSNFPDDFYNIFQFFELFLYRSKHTRCTLIQDSIGE